MINQLFLTDDNAAFVQRFAAEQNLQAVGVKTDTKNHVAFYKNGINQTVQHENLELVPNWLGGIIVYKIINIGEQIVLPPNEYRNSKILRK